MIERNTTKLCKLLKAMIFLQKFAVYDALGARLVEHAGFEAVYNGGYVVWGSRAVSEPLLTMTEQITQASDAAAAVNIPMVVDAGAGFRRSPLHTMRTVREFIRAGIAGVHIEDQLFPSAPTTTPTRCTRSRLKNSARRSVMRAASGSGSIRISSSFPARIPVGSSVWT